ncbi:MAG: glycosyltransferase family 39 protein [Candidatus Dormibacteria bacterium]
MAAVVVAAAILRLWALDAQPGGLYPDEAAEAYDAHRLLHTPGFHPVFFQDDAGREALYGYLVAIAFRVAGETTTVLRATSAVLGVLAVVAVYLWLRRRGETVALAAAAWVAGSLWLVCISRDGMRNVLVPVVGALALWAMSSWADRPARNGALLAGAAMALGLWTYQPLKLLPVLFLAWALWLRARDAARWKAMRPLLRWVALAYVVVGAPMIYTAATDPGHYFGRALAVTAGGQAASGAGLIEHTVRTLLMFPLTGDPNQRHDVNALPMLGVPMTALTGLGAWAAWRRRHEPLESLVLIAIPVFLVPPLVATADAAPHFLRSLGLAAPVAALVGMGVAEAMRLGLRFAPAPAVAAAVSVLLAAQAAAAAGTYFSRPVSARYDAYSFNLVQLAEAARTAAPSAVLLDDYRATNLRFLDRDELATGRVSIRPPRPDPGSSPLLPGCGVVVFALGKDDLARVLGAANAAHAVPAAYDPQGNPSVWRTSC